MDGGTHGIAGVAFDPTGDWLYSGTEKTLGDWTEEEADQKQNDRPTGISDD